MRLLSVLSYFVWLVEIWAQMVNANFSVKYHRLCCELSKFASSDNSRYLIF